MDMGKHLEEQTIPVTTGKPAAEGSTRIEETGRWVRAYFGGLKVADSKRVLLVWEPRRLPVYYFPTQDVRMDLLRAAKGGPGSEKARFDLVVGSRIAENAAWRYTDRSPEHERISDYVGFHWRQLEAWYEEDDEVFVHPRDPYHRVDVLQSSRHVRVDIEGQVVAETRRPRLLFETGLPTRYYIPKQDVRMDLLDATGTSTACPYKGQARYWSVRVGDKVIDDLVWSYPAPIPECPKIENLLSFYNEKVDIYVDGELQVRPLTPWS